MSGSELVQDLLSQFLETNPNVLIEMGNPLPMTDPGQRGFVQLLDFARTLQIAHPTYETAYQHLVHLFVLCGSRASLLAALDRRMQNAFAGQSALILIEGASGIGKTSLAMVQGVRAQELGAVFVAARSYEQGATPFWLWKEVIRLIEKLTGTASDDLPSPFGKSASAQSMQHLIQALTDWLSVCCAVKPLVILLDDLHWADVDSLEILNRLVGQLEQSSILFITTYRSEDIQRGQPFYDYIPLFRRNRTVENLRLHPLTKADTFQLVTAYRGLCHPQLADYLYQRAEGHPLFTIELLHDLVEQGLLFQDADGAWLAPDQSIPVPTLLKQLILQRVSRLGEASETILLHAAVVGESWTLDLVEHLAGLPEEAILNAVEDALKVDLIRIVNEHDEVYQFSHGLIREVLYIQQLPRRRKRLHQSIGAYLEQQDVPDSARLAHHFYEAENWEKAGRYCAEAGEQAAKNFANNRALDLYHKAIDALQRGKPPLNLPALMRAYEQVGTICRVIDKQVEADEAFSRMRDLAHSMGDLKSEGLALTNLVLTRLSQYRLDASEQTAQEALNIAEKLRDVRLLAQAHSVLGRLLLVRGQLTNAEHHFSQYRHHSDVLKDFESQSDMLRQRAYLELWSGRISESVATAQQCLDHGLKAGNLLQISSGYQILSFCQTEAGNYAEAYQNIRAILDQTEVTDPYHHQLVRLLNQMGYLFLELGDAEQALSWDQRALDASQISQGISRYEMKRYSLLNIATDLLTLGKLEEAQAWTARFEAMMDAPDYAHFRYHNRYLILRGELHLAEHDFKQAISFAHEARAFAEEYSAAKNIAKSHWLEGQALMGLNQRLPAVRHLQDAVKIADEIQHGSLRWKMRLSLAKALVSMGDSPEAALHQAQALISQTRRSLAGTPLRDVFSETYWMERLYESSPSASDGKPAYPAGLSQREVEILRLVASGATNQKIAAALTISPRTVNTHITNILNKTGCENRTAASAFAMKHNLLST